MHPEAFPRAASHLPGAAVSPIASDIASLPLILYPRTGDGGKERATNHLRSATPRRAKPRDDIVVLRETMHAHLLTWGNPLGRSSATGQAGRSTSGRWCRRGDAVSGPRRAALPRVQP